MDGLALGAFNAEEVKAFGKVADIECVHHCTTIVFNVFSRNGATGHIGNSEGELASFFGGQHNVHRAAGGVREDVQVADAVFLDVGDNLIGEFKTGSFNVVVGHEMDSDFVGGDGKHVFFRPVVNVNTFQQFVFLGDFVFINVNIVTKSEFNFGIGEVGGGARVD